MTGAKQIYLAIATIACCILTMVTGCSEKQPEPMQPVAKPSTGHTFSVKGSVREMNIVPEITNFPDGEGKNEFTSYCSMCHSLRYITTQPDFPRSIWEEEVHKMVIKYNAPIDSVTCNKIVNYLVAIKSAK